MSGSLRGALPTAPLDNGEDADPQDQLDLFHQPRLPPKIAPVPLLRGTPQGQALDTGRPDPVSFIGELRAQRRAQEQAQRDAYNPGKATPIEGAPSFGVPEAPPKTSMLGDFGRQAWIATTQMGQAAVGAASFSARQLGADPTTVEYLEDQKAKLADYVATQADKLSPAAKAAMHASLFGGKDAEGHDLPSPGEVGWGHYVGASVASAVPQIALAVLPGSLVGRVATTIAGRTAGMLAGGATTATAFGAQSAGEGYNAFVQAIDDAKDDELKRNPAYAEMRAQGTDEVEAKRNLVRIIAPHFVAMHAGAGALAGVGIGSMLTQGALGAATKSVLTRAAVGGAEGAATMGGQAGAENVLDQQAQQQAGIKTEFDPTETARAFASGALGGAVLGAGGGALHKREAQPQPQPAPAKPVLPALPERTLGPAERQAMQAQLAPVEQMPGQGELPGTSPQGELFSADQAGQGRAPVQPQIIGTDLRPGMPGATQPDMFAEPPRPQAQPAQQMELPLQRQQAAPEPAPAPAQQAPVQANPVPTTTAEPAGDIRAQLRALIDPNNPKDAVFVAKGTPIPSPLWETPNSKRPVGIYASPNSAGTLFTTDPAKARTFRAKKVTDEELATILGMGQPKSEVLAAAQKGEAAQVVQAKDEHGAVVGEALATPAGAVLEAERLKAQVPNGRVEVATPEQAQARRAELVDAQPPIEAQPKEITPEVAPTPVVSEVAPEPPAKPKSARQLEKERMAAAQGERMKGEVVTAQADKAPERERVERPFEDAYKDTVDTLDAVGRKNIATIKKGDLPRVMEKLQRELQAAIRGAGSPEDMTEGRLHEAVARWGAHDANPIPGTKTRRGDLADTMLKLMTGKGLTEHLPGSSEAKREIHETLSEDRGRTGAAPKLTPDADTQSAAEPAQSVGVQRIEGKAKERSAASNKTRTLDDLADDVRAGTKTVHEAAEEYGSKAVGSKGAPRRFADFGAYLDHLIGRAEDPKVETELLTKLAQTHNNKALSPAKRAEQTKEINRLLESTGADAAERLRGWRDQLRDPVGHAVDAQDAQEGKSYPREATPSGINPQSSRYVRMAADPRINRAVRSLLLQRDEAGEHTTSHEILRAIHNSSLIKEELRPLWELAGRLLKLAPNIPIMTNEVAARTGLKYESGAYGAFHAYDDGRPSHITLGTDAGDLGHVSLALHEIVHSVTAAHLEEASRVGGRDVQLLQAIGDELRANHAGPLLEGALSSPHELHTMLMSEPAVQALAARTPVSDAFRARMAELGYEAPAGKSIWRVFTDWVRRALGLGEPGSASEATLLDHILRPLQDITDRGAAFNRRAFERSVTDPVVRSYARPMLDATGGRLGASAADALRHVDLSTVGEKGRRAVLAFGTTDAIHDRYRPLFTPGDRLAFRDNPLSGFRTAIESIQHTTKEAYDKHADRASSLVAKLKGDPSLGPLMNDATLAGVHLGDGADNSHLKPEQADSLRELQGRFEKLSPASKAAYAEARDTYEQWHRVEREERLRSMVRLALPDATEDQVKEIGKVLRSKKATEEFLNKGDSDALAQSFGAEWHDNRALVRGVAKVHRLGFVQGDYFPLRRFGDYVVRYGDEETPGVEFFQSKREAEARRTELIRQGENVIHQVDLKRESMRKDMGVAAPLVDAVADKARRNPELSGHAEALRDLMASTMLEYASRSESARTALRRKGVRGASADAGRVMAQEFVGHGARLGHIMHDPERNQALRHMSMVADDLAKYGQAGDSIRARQVIQELEKRISTGDDAQGAVSGFARRASVLGFVQSLMSPSHMLTSTIEAHMNSTSLLGARHGAGRAGLALTKALMEVSPKLLGRGASMTFKAGFKGLKASDWNLADMARDRLVSAGADRTAMAKLFEGLDRANLIDHSMEREMRRIASPGGLATTGVGRVWQRFLDLNAAGAHAVDVANKAAVAKAAYDLEFKKSGDQARAIAYAVDTTRKVMPNYNLGNKPRIATSAGPLGAFAAPITQFKMYGMHMYGVMANLVRDSMHGASKEERREARKAFAGILATHAVMAGAISLIADPLRYVGGAYDFITGDSPHDYQADVRGFLADVFGPEMGELIARGAPHAAGIDIHRRVGLGNLLEIPELKSFDKKGVMEMFAAAMTGAAGDDAASMVDGVRKLAGGDMLAGLQGIVPRVIRDPMKAAHLADQGVTDSRGKTILPSSKLTPWDISLQAVGFQPARVSEFREGREAVREAMQETQSEHNHLTQAWLQADPTDRAAVMARIREFNMEHPAQPITMAALIRSLQQRQQDTSKSNQFGLRMPTQAARELTRAGRFANVQ